MGFSILVRCCLYIESGPRLWMRHLIAHSAPLLYMLTFNPPISQKIFFKYTFLNENVWILLKNSLRFVPEVRMNNIPALVKIMAQRRPGDKPLSEPMMAIVYWCIYLSLVLNESKYQCWIYERKILSSLTLLQSKTYLFPSFSNYHGF